MTTATYSAVLDHPVEAVWSLIRDFNNYPAYIEGVTESTIEDDRRGDEVGAIRRFLHRGNSIRQRLAGHCDELHSLTYVGIDPLTFPQGLLPETPAPARYEGTIRLQRIVDGERTFIEWSVALDTEPEEADSWRNLLQTWISVWTGDLGTALARRAAGNR
jgi:Polyketide cyclase / dehydrase and lipid transport